MGKINFKRYRLMKSVTAIFLKLCEKNEGQNINFMIPCVWAIYKKLDNNFNSWLSRSTFLSKLIKKVCTC